MANLVIKRTVYGLSAALVILLAGCGDDGGSGGASNNGDGASNGDGTSNVAFTCANGGGLEGVNLGQASVGETFEAELPQTEDGATNGGVNINPPVGQQVTYDVVAPEGYPHEVSISLWDTDNCRRMLSDHQGDSINRLTYTRQDGEQLALYLSGSGASEGPVPIELQLVEGTIVEDFCTDHTDSLTLGEPMEGNLDMSADPNGGPHGNMWKSYTIDLQEGQTVSVDLEVLDNVIMSAFLYTPDCVRIFPTLEANSDDPSVVTAPTTGTYTVLVNALNPAGGDYRVTVDAQ